MDRFGYSYLLNAPSVVFSVGIFCLSGGIGEIEAEARGISEFGVSHLSSIETLVPDSESFPKENQSFELISSSTTIFPDGSRCEGLTQAVCTYANGDRYEGEVQNAQPQGKGKMIYANGDRYEGEFQNGQLQGKGTIFYKNGDRYTGEFQGGNFSGNGIYILKTGEQIAGQWQTDKFEPVASGESGNVTVAPVIPGGVKPKVVEITRTPQPVTQVASPTSEPNTAESQRNDATVPTPLQAAPTRLFNLETANQLDTGQLSVTVGGRVHSTDRTGLGTGLQIGSAAVDYGLANNLQLGLGVSLFDDTLGRRINGNIASLGFNSIAPNIKYQILKNDNLIVSLGGSVEFIHIKSNGSLFTTGSADSIAGSLQVPVSYNVSRELQVHLVPELAFFPNSVSGNREFYGTLFNLGLGVSWQPLSRLNFFADVSLPISGKGNTVSSATGAFAKQAVYSAGLRYLVNPAVGLDLYATNGFGMTPATRLLAFVPDGNQVAIGANLTYTPSTGQKYADTFRTGQLVPLTNRDQQLLLDGFTLASADTLLPGMFHVWGGTGAGTNINLAYGLTNDVQLELFGQKFSENGDPTAKNNISSFNIGAAAKLRFLDQVQGDPLSLSFKFGFSPFIAGNAQETGYFTAELPAMYRLNSQIALTFNPKAGFVNNTSLVGAGLGINYALFDALQVIGEYTPLLKGDGGRGGVWSVGFRYLYPQLNLGVDVYGTNAIGQGSLGGLFARTNGASVGFNLHWLFGGNFK